MYAILEHGGHQYRVSAGDRLLVDRLPADVGTTVTLEPVVLIADGDSTTVDAAALRGASVTAVVVAHRRGHKIRVFSYKPKKRHRRTLGFRSQLTELRVESVQPGGDGHRRSSSPRKEADAAPSSARRSMKSAEADGSPASRTHSRKSASSATPSAADASAADASVADASAAEAPADVEAPADQPAAEKAQPKPARPARKRKPADGA